MAARTVKICMVPLIRNIFRLMSRKHWERIKRDLRPICTAVNAEQHGPRSTSWPASGMAATLR